MSPLGNLVDESLNLKTKPAANLPDPPNVVGNQLYLVKLSM